ncbi:16275_t:CDS:2 [Funneliformis geosporum]|nr:16275_t:CDS:2 [Funneliformis geosporum]
MVNKEVIEGESFISQYHEQLPLIQQLAQEKKQTFRLAYDEYGDNLTVNNLLGWSYGKVRALVNEFKDKFNLQDIEELCLGNDIERRLEEGIHNRFTDSLEPLQNLTKSSNRFNFSDIPPLNMTTGRINKHLQARDTLKRVLQTAQNEAEKMGVVQAFEICYELAWRIMKKILRFRGADAKKRNITVHCYRKEILDDLFTNTAKEFLEDLNYLLTQLEKEAPNYDPTRK